jgi:long-subunit acyl-CoA synthetase (AMP-forming)
VNSIPEGNVPGSVGPILPNVEVKLIDEQGNTVGPNVVGEIMDRGISVMRGYWNLPKKPRMYCPKTDG